MRGADAGGGVAAADPQGVAEQDAGGGDGELVGEAGVLDFADEPDLRGVHGAGDGLEEPAGVEEFGVRELPELRVPQ